MKRLMFGASALVAISTAAIADVGEAGLRFNLIEFGASGVLTKIDDTLMSLKNAPDAALITVVIMEARNVVIKMAAGKLDVADITAGLSTSDTGDYVLTTVFGTTELVKVVDDAMLRHTKAMIELHNGNELGAITGNATDAAHIVRHHQGGFGEMMAKRASTFAANMRARFAAPQAFFHPRDTFFSAV